MSRIPKPLLRSVFVSCALIAAEVSLNGCATENTGKPTVGVVKPALVVDAAKDFKPLTVNEVVVYPFASSQSGANIDKGAQLDEALLQSLQAYTTLKLVNIEDPKQVSETFRTLPAIAPVERARALGIAVGAQGVITGELHKFVESDGGKYGASNSSAVGFTLRLIDPRSGRILWSASFDREDEPLTQNLFRLPEAMKEGVTFKSSLAMATSGFSDAAKALQKSRDLQ